MNWCQLRTRSSGISETPNITTAVVSVITTRPWPIHQKQICTSSMVSCTAVTTANGVWARMILHRAAYSWHWRIDIIYARRSHETYLPALAAGLMSIMSELHHELEAEFFVSCIEACYSCLHDYDQKIVSYSVAIAFRVLLNSVLVKIQLPDYAQCGETVVVCSHIAPMILFGTSLRHNPMANTTCNENPHFWPIPQQIQWNLSITTT